MLIWKSWFQHFIADVLFNFRLSRCRVQYSFWALFLPLAVYLAPFNKVFGWWPVTTQLLLGHDLFDWRVMRRNHVVFLCYLREMVSLVKLMNTLLWDLELHFSFREKLSRWHLPLVFRCWLFNRVQLIFISLASDPLIILNLNQLRFLRLIKFINISLAVDLISLDPKVSLESLP